MEAERTGGARWWDGRRISHPGLCLPEPLLQTATNGDPSDMLFPAKTFKGACVSDGVCAIFHDFTSQAAGDRDHKPEATIVTRSAIEV